jgi:hypothetical protein
MPPKAKAKAKLQTPIAKAQAHMMLRKRHLERVELLHKLHQASEAQRARAEHLNLQADADRMEGEIHAARVPGHHGGMTAAQRAAHRHRIAALRQAAARLLVR